VLLALAPGLLSDALFLLVVLISSVGARRTIGEFGGALLYCALFLPVAIPFYLSLLGRSYVKKVHSGLKSAVPFVVMYCVANLAIWACGAAIVGFQITKF
jgi:hypothetical protein